MKKGVILMAYGSPDKPEDIEPYYTDIRRGRRPSPEQLEELTGRYNAIGGGSPLLRITTEQANMLQQELGNDYQVFLGMRHWKPWILEAVEKLQEHGIDNAVGIVMAPHYSSMSIAKYIEKVEEAKAQVHPALRMSYVKSWHTHALYINALLERINTALASFSEGEKKDIHFVFTAHSLPEKILENNDPYKEQLLETCHILAGKQHIKNWSFAFQSAGRTQEKWLGPDLIDVLKDLHDKNVKAVLVCSVGFITDHLEVLYDIDIEAKAMADKLGMHLERAASLNAAPQLAKLFAELIRQEKND